VSFGVEDVQLDEGVLIVFTTAGQPFDKKILEELIEEVDEDSK